METIVIAGGTGFLGQALVRHLQDRYQIVILSRKAQAAQGDIRYEAWDGRSPGPWAAALEGAAALVNLVGRSVDCRYTPANRRAILDSRVASTRVLGQAVAACAVPPRVWLQSSTATIYAYAEREGHTEARHQLGHGFSIDVARAWEHTFEQAATPSTRRVVLRSAIVLGSQGNAYRILRRLAAWGLGGPQGPGRQMMSWIHIEDWCRAMEFLLVDDAQAGIFNLSAPEPLPNRAFQRVLRQTLGQPIGLPAPAWLVRLGAWVLGTEAELVLKSRYVLPGRLLEAGFTFTYPTLEEAIGDLEAITNL